MKAREGQKTGSIDDERPIQKRLWSAYHYKLSSLQRDVPAGRRPEP